MLPHRKLGWVMRPYGSEATEYDSTIKRRISLQDPNSAFTSCAKFYGHNKPIQTSCMTCTGLSVWTCVRCLEAECNTDSEDSDTDPCSQCNKCPQCRMRVGDCNCKCPITQLPLLECRCCDDGKTDAQRAHCAYLHRDDVLGNWKHCDDPESEEHSEDRIRGIWEYYGHNTLYNYDFNSKVGGRNPNWQEKLEERPNAGRHLRRLWPEYWRQHLIDEFRYSPRQYRPDWSVLTPEQRPTQPAAVDNDQFLSDHLPKIMLEAESKSFDVNGHSVRIPGYA